MRPLYVGATLSEKLNTAAFGAIGATESFNKADSWARLLTKPRLTEAEKSYLVQEVVEAFIEGNAVFFNALAFLCRNQNTPVKDRLRYGLLISTFGHFGQKREWKKKELIEELEKAGFEWDERHLRRVCKELGIKITADKSGRPPKSGH